MKKAQAKGMKVRFKNGVVQYIPFETLESYQKYHEELLFLVGGNDIDEILEKDVELFEVVCLKPGSPFRELFSNDIDMSPDKRYLPKKEIERKLESGHHVIVRGLGEISNIEELAYRLPGAVNPGAK